MLTDLISLFNIIIRTLRTTEKRLLIDLPAARAAYEKIFDDTGWVKTIDNLADAFTEMTISNALGKFTYTVYFIRMFINGF